MTKIISLCAEGGKKDPFVYYPTEESPALSNYNVDNGRNYSVLLDSKRTVSDDNITRRYFECAYYDEHDKSRVVLEQNVEHIHFKSWKDMEGCDPSVMQALMSLAKDDVAPFLSKQFDEVFVHKPGNVPPERVLIHCNGGLGRTGTMMAIVNSFIPINEYEEGGLKTEEFRLSIFSIVRRLKEQRYGLVKNEK